MVCLSFEKEEKTPLERVQSYGGVIAVIFAAALFAGMKVTGTLTVIGYLSVVVVIIIAVILWGFIAFYGNRTRPRRFAV